MRFRLLITQFFRALFVSGGWIWHGSVFVVSIALAGLPAWAHNIPIVARMMDSLGLPYWAYGLAGMAVVACFFAWRVAEITTPKIVVTDASIGPQGRVRIEIKNTSFTRCEKLMCALTAVYNGCSTTHPGDDASYWTEHTTDFPLVLPTQSRLRQALSTISPLPVERWSLDPGNPKNIEILQLKGIGGNGTVIHESGTEIIEMGRVTTFCLRITGDTAPVSAFVVIYQTEKDGYSYIRQVMLAKNEFEILVLQQFSADELMSKRAIDLCQ